MRSLLHKAISIYINPFFNAEEFLEAFSQYLITWFFSAAYIIYEGVCAII